MYSQNHQQGHSARLNGAGRGLPGMLYNYQHAQHQHPSQAQHHQGMQHEHGLPSSNGLGHHSSFPSGLLSSAQFSSGLQNGHSSASRAGPVPQNEMWAEQLRLHKESERAHSAMTDQQQPHYYARLKASENKGIGGPPPSSGQAEADCDDADRRRPWDASREMNRQDWHNMDMSGQGLRNLAPALFRYQFLGELYIASNKLSRLPKQIGDLRQLKHLDVSYNQLTEIPPELGMCTFLKQLLLFNNNIQELPYELGSLHMLDVLGIEGNPLESSVKSEIMEKGTRSLITAFRENAPVPPEPEPRKSIVLQEDVSPNLERVKVFSWNILCEKYATAQLYGYTPTRALKWEYRLECILKEIRYRDADFVTLQEVSGEAYRDELAPKLIKDGYRGIYWPKTRVRTMPEKDALQVDGCAIFFKQSKWFMIAKECIEFNSIAINRADMNKEHDVFNRVMPKDNIAIVAFFESRETGARIIVSNVHLTWETTLADVKAIQTAILMEQITKLAELWAKLGPAQEKDKRLIVAPGEESKPPPPKSVPSQEYRCNTELPLIVCGDFNSTEDSSVFEIMSKGRVAPDHPELIDHQYGSFTRDGIEHPFSLRDAYGATKGTADEMPFTNYTPGFTGVIDYIWYSNNALEAVEVLGAMDNADLKRIPAFPNWWFPADHIQIMAEFAFKARKEKKQSIQDREHSLSGSSRRG
ncbi:hypothetical protein LMH87_007376 [Akanthomyces muscarius]|uniref:CCR4-Not complex 3'-5'-exoribonuclease subunit Ccr4 n=1 Tax=Akanthomyces muscarius TaxID=2231603 RepID=A0A9W8QS52_AKAMU|nr:hypothetical protein LMH87_007376 [Akanthomyces muscarius]KAJ4165756.1 hypothetical protein LMH87_007376 [Akanthomyces muscarius]